MTEVFFVLHSARRILWVAALLCFAVLLFTHDYLRIAAAGGLAGSLGVAVMMRVRRPRLTVDDAGYSVHIGEREIVRVTWGEVARVLIDPDNEAAYVDCGDPARNLLLPPRFGGPFTYTNRARLYARLSTAVPERNEIRAGLSPQTPANHS